MDITEEVRQYTIKKSNIEIEKNKKLISLYEEFKNKLFPLIPVKVGDKFTYVKDHGYTRNGEIITVKVIEVVLTDDALVMIDALNKNLNGKWGNRKELLTIMKLDKIDINNLYTKYGEPLTKIEE